MGYQRRVHGELDHSDQSCIIMKFLVAFSAVVAMVSAEADPYLLGYGAGYGYGLGYAGLKSAPCVNAANVPVPCASGYLHYGKREAEAEPYLGYGLGYAGYGYAGIGLKSAPCVNAANVPVPAMDLDTDTTTERGKPRLSLSTDTLVLDTPVSDTLVSDTDTESTPAMSVCAPTIWELPFLAKKLRYLQENSKIWEFYRKNYEIKF